MSVIKTKKKITYNFGLKTNYGDNNIRNEKKISKPIPTFKVKILLKVYLNM